MTTSIEEALRSGAVRSGWEFFQDEGYFGMWCVREVGSSGFIDGFHVASQEEARALRSLLEERDRLKVERDEAREPSFPADGEWLSMEHAERRNTFEDWARKTPLPLHMAESGMGRFYADDRTEWAWQTFALCGGAVAKAERDALASGRAHQAMTDKWLSAKAEIETLETWLSGQRGRGDFYNDLAEKAEARSLAAEAKCEGAQEQAESFKAMYRQACDWRDAKIAAAEAEVARLKARIADLEERHYAD